MFCSNCGNNLNDDALVCDACGAPVNSPNYEPNKQQPEASPIIDQVNNTHDNYSNSSSYNSYNNNNNSYNPHEENKYGDPTKNGYSITSLVLGICNIIICCVPFLSIIVSIIGIVLGVIGLKSEKRGMSVAGIILCCVFIVLSILWTIFAIVINFSQM